MTADGVKLFLCGDVMPARGIDQVLAHPGDPQLHEAWIRNAREYRELAELRNGPIPQPARPAYVWGDALAVLAAARPAARIINLETSVTTSDQFWPGKGVHYRLHPANLDLLTCAAIDCCVLANNHVLDWGYAGLMETLDSLYAAGIATTGAGRDADAALRPATLPLPGGARLRVFGLACPSSGVPAAWAATAHHAGVNLLPPVRERTPNDARDFAAAAGAVRCPGDLLVASIHWGPNWGYDIPAADRAFAHTLIDHGIDLVHGHSSHHVKGIEVYRGKLILYGCGDLLNDYEGIGGHAEYRGDLGLLYFATLDPDDGCLRDLELVPMTVLRFSLRRPPAAATDWLMDTLAGEGERFTTRVEPAGDGHLRLAWQA